MKILCCALYFLSLIMISIGFFLDEATAKDLIFFSFMGLANLITFFHFNK